VIAAFTSRRSKINVFASQDMTSQGEEYSDSNVNSPFLKSKQDNSEATVSTVEILTLLTQCTLFKRVSNITMCQKCDSSFFLAISNV